MSTIGGKNVTIRVCEDRLDITQVLAIARACHWYNFGSSIHLPSTWVVTTLGFGTRREPFFLSFRPVFRPPIGFGAPGIPGMSSFQLTGNWRGDPFSRGSKGEKDRFVQRPTTNTPSRSTCASQTCFTRRFDFEPPSRRERRHVGSVPELREAVLRGEDEKRRRRARIASSGTNSCSSCKRTVRCA